MPRSAPGASTRRPSSSTSPALGASSPATMRSSVLLPQPLGPRIVMKSFSATSRSVACSANVAPKRRSTARTDRIALIEPASSPELRPWEQAPVAPLEGEVADQPDQADHDDAEDDLVGRQQGLAVGDHVADAARRADQLGDDHVG